MLKMTYSWKMTFEFFKVVAAIGEVDKFVTFWCGIFSGFHVPNCFIFDRVIQEKIGWHFAFFGPWCT